MTFLHRLLLLIFCFTEASRVPAAERPKFDGEPPRDWVGYDQRGDASLETFVAAAERPLVWWNIAGRENAMLRETRSRLPIDRALGWLVTPKRAPETLVLGEYQRAGLAADTIKALETRYSSRLFIPYNELNPDFGIYVLSRARLALEKAVPIGWRPKNALGDPSGRYRDEPELKYFERRAIVVRVTAPKHDYRLVPVHLMTDLSTRLKRAGRLGRLCILLELFYARTSPTHVQLRNLLQTLDPGVEPTLMIGDFNLPSVEIRGVRICSRSLEQIESVFTPLTPNGGPTFPTAGFADLYKATPNVRAMRLDYAFTSAPTTSPTRALVLTLAGSDHLPLALLP